MTYRDNIELCYGTRSAYILNPNGRKIGDGISAIILETPSANMWYDDYHIVKTTASNGRWLRECLTAADHELKGRSHLLAAERIRNKKKAK